MVDAAVLAVMLSLAIGAAFSGVAYALTRNPYLTLAAAFLSAGFFLLCFGFSGIGEPAIDASAAPTPQPTKINLRVLMNASQTPQGVVVMLLQPLGAVS